MTFSIKVNLESIWVSHKFGSCFILNGRLSHPLIDNNEIVEERSARVKIRFNLNKELTLSDDKLLLLVKPGAHLCFEVEKNFDATLDKDGNRIKCFKALNFEHAA